MALTNAASGLTVQQWDDEFFLEYIQGNRFASEMGTSENSIVQVKEDLTSKKGESVTFALANRLSGDGVTGNETLTGSEEKLITRSHKVEIVERGNGVEVSNTDEQYSAISLRMAAKSALRTWAEENTRDRIIAAMASINGVAYGSATEVQKDAWLADNADRVLFGDALGNNSSNDHSASLANVTSAMSLDTGAISLMKRMALTASPKIRPYMSKNKGRRYYCAYVHPRAFRDLQSDTALQQAQREVSLKMQNEKLFEGGDLYWDGVIIKELDDITVLSGVGDSSIDLAPVFFCGAQAVGYAINRRWYSTEDSRDHGRFKSCGVFAFDGFEKLRFGTGNADTDNRKDHGMVTGYFPAVADS